MKTFAGGALPAVGAATAASLGGVSGIATDGAGNVYLALGDYDLVVRIDANGALVRVAGTGTKGFSGDIGDGADAQLSSPRGLASDAAGNLYIVDGDNSRVRVVANGTIRTIAGNGAQGYDGDGDQAVKASFNGPSAIAVDRVGNIYVADFFNQVVRKISGGTVTTIAGNGTFGYNGDGLAATDAQLAGPSGIALDAAGNLYIADGYNNRVRKVSGGIITTVAGNGTAGFSGDKAAATSATLRQPSDVAVDSSGRLYIADYGNNRIRMVASGTITTVAGNGALTFSGDAGPAVSAGLAAPLRLAFDAADSLYVADGVRVRKIAAGVIATVGGGGAPAGESGPALAAQLLTPQAVAVDGAGNVYISDAGTGRVLEVSGGTIQKLAGTGTQGMSGDGGSAANAQLAAPVGIAVDAAGSVYVSDGVNLRVRRIAGGVISAFAGGGTTLGDGGAASKAQLAAPEGLAADGAGNLYIADLNRVRMVAGGVITTAAGNGGVGYQGDGGVATAARISSASGVAAAAGNLYIADSGNNRVRMVANGTITTVAGNGTYGFTGSGGTATSATLGTPNGVAADATGDFYVTDSYRVLRVSKGKIAAIAGIAGPRGLAVDAAGNVYVADPANHRVQVLTPVGTACAVTATPGTQQVASAGGAVTVNVGTGAGCAWAIDNLPGWISAAGRPFGAGPAVVTLMAAANPDMPRSSVILVGGQSVTVTQAGAATIVGQVTLRTATGDPVGGVTVAMTGTAARQVTTDAGGNFAIAGVDSTGTYTVTPTLLGYNFVPASLTFSNMASNPTANFAAWPLPAVGAVGPVFASSLQSLPVKFAAGEIVTVYGTNLCGTAASAAPTLPDRISACIVQVDGVNLRLYYGSDSQINAVLPQSLALGAHQLTVQRYTDTGYKQMAAQSQALAFTVDRVGLALVERKDGAATVLAAQFTDGGFAGSTRPVKPGDTIVVYGTGLGRKLQSFAEGAAPKVASASVETVQVVAQGQAGKVLYAGVQPQFPGLDQITVQLPGYTLPAGKKTVTIQISTPATGETVSYELDSN